MSRTAFSARARKTRGGGGEMRRCRRVVDSCVKVAETERPTPQFVNVSLRYLIHQSTAQGSLESRQARCLPAAAQNGSAFHGVRSCRPRELGQVCNTDPINRRRSARPLGGLYIAIIGLFRPCFFLALALSIYRLCSYVGYEKHGSTPRHVLTINKSSI